MVQALRMLCDLRKKNDKNDKKQSSTCFQAFTNEEIEYLCLKIAWIK